MLLSELDYALSIKIGDPVSENGDGVTFHREDRVKYIERAYSRMLRVLPKLMKEYCPTFANSKSTLDINFHNAGYLSYFGYTQDEADQFKLGKNFYLKSNDTLKTTIPFKKIHEIRLRIKKLAENSLTYSFASYLDPNLYMTVKHGNSDMYTATPEKTFYTVMDEKIFFLPLFINIDTLTDEQVEGYYITSAYEYEAAEVVFTKDAPILSTVADLKTYDLTLAHDYVDLLIVMAAYEAMQDIARQDKAQLYANDITGQLNILTGYAQSEKSEQGVK